MPVTEEGETKPRTVIEVKAEGGYVLAPPSPAACHPAGRCYTPLFGKGLTEVPTVTDAERDVLFACGRRLDLWTPPARPDRPRRAWPADAAGGRPGDEFNARADWQDVLRPHGWTWAGPTGGGGDARCRPGKAGGTSATTDFAGTPLLYVFSTNAAPFEADAAYSKFHAYALLNHDGDHPAAARGRARQGYGRRRPAGVQAAPLARYAGYASRALGRAT